MLLPLIRPIGCFAGIADFADQALADHADQRIGDEKRTDTKIAQPWNGADGTVAVQR